MSDTHSLQEAGVPRLFVDLRPVICSWCGTATNAERSLFGKATKRRVSLSSIFLHASLNIQHTWFGKAAMIARLLSKYLCSGSFAGVLDTPFVLREDSTQRPLRCISLLGLTQYHPISPS